MSAARGFTAIPNHIIRDGTIPPATRLLYGVIVSYAWGARACTASAATLCDEAGMGRTAFFDGIALLVKRNLLEVQKRKSRNGWRNIYVPVLKGMEIPELDERDGRPESERRVDRNPDIGSSASRSQKKTKVEEEGEADASPESREEPDPRTSAPPGFPDELRPHARHVLQVLRSVAEQHGANEVYPLAVGRVIMAYPRRPLVETAHALATWAVDPPRAVRDVVSTYRTFLKRERDLAATERLAGDGTPTSGRAPDAAGVTPLFGGGGRMSNDEKVNATIQALRSAGSSQDVLG